jgi:hypothetical protein
MKLQSALLTAVILALQDFYSSAATLYVDLNSANPTPPYADWSTAATNIQDAIDASTDDDFILVTNGVYATGGEAVNGYSLTNRVVINKAVTVQSVNGASVTVIEGNPLSGDSAVRCVYLTNGAALTGFTLRNGATRNDGDWDHELWGGGVWCESSNILVSSCILSNNMASDSGGGSYQGTLESCLVVSNSSTGNGAGAYFSTLTNCTVIGNSAGEGGGGACACILTNCAVIGNSAGQYGGGVCSSTLEDCTVIGNSAADTGGGVCDGLLNNCLIVSNTATEGGGVSAPDNEDKITLNNCTLNGNSATDSGGGAYGGTLNNCVLYANSASDAGGGAFGSYLNACLITSNSAAGAYSGGADGVLNNCVISHNFAQYSGGADGYLVNCTLVYNTASQEGGGVYESELYNCIIYNNSSPEGANTIYSELYSCCVPDNINGYDDRFECITNEPLFVNLTNDFLLQSNSPCINSGNNAYVTVTNDLDGNPRIVGGTVDIGAYEFQSPSSILSYAWAQQYGLSTDGSADYLDSDGDGMNNWREWIAGTDPTNALSVLQMLSPTTTNNPSGLVISWQSVSNITYYLQSSVNLAAQPSFTTIQSNIVGQAGTTSYTDTNAVGNGPYFYRVGVQQ